MQNPLGAATAFRMKLTPFRITHQDARASLSPIALHRGLHVAASVCSFLRWHPLPCLQASPHAGPSVQSTSSTFSPTHTSSHIVLCPAVAVLTSATPQRLHTSGTPLPRPQGDGRGGVGIFPLSLCVWSLRCVLTTVVPCHYHCAAVRYTAAGRHPS